MEPSTSQPGRGAWGQTPGGGGRGLPHTRDSLTGCWKETLKLESVRGHTSNCRSPAASEENNISEQGLCWPSMHQETRPHLSRRTHSSKRSSLLSLCGPVPRPYAAFLSLFSVLSAYLAPISPVCVRVCVRVCGYLRHYISSRCKIRQSWTACEGLK